MNDKKELKKEEAWACGHHISDDYFAKVKKLAEQEKEVHYDRPYDLTKDKYDD